MERSNEPLAVQYLIDTGDIGDAKMYERKHIEEAFIAGAFYASKAQDQIEQLSKLYYSLRFANNI